jgi:ABC-2 type transport system permease protein
MTTDTHTPPPLPTQPEPSPHAPLNAAHFVRTARAVASFTTWLLLRGRRIRVMAAVIFLPAVMPFVLAYLAPDHIVIDGYEVFVIGIEFLYIGMLVPLGAIFFATSLLGDEMENRTFPLLLSRPIPRSALVAGKFVAYAIVCSVFFIASIFALFAACVVALKLPLSVDNAIDLAAYCAVLIAGVFAYGAFCLAASTMTKRPVVLAIIFVYGWEQFTLILPGYPRLFSIQAYLKALLPDTPFERWYEQVTVIMDFIALTHVPIGPTRAVISLTLIVAVLLALSSYVVRNKEYAASPESV